MEYFCIHVIDASLDTDMCIGQMHLIIINVDCDYSICVGSVHDAFDAGGSVIAFLKMKLKCKTDVKCL